MRSTQRTRRPSRGPPSLAVLVGRRNHPPPTQPAPGRLSIGSRPRSIHEHEKIARDGIPSQLQRHQRREAIEALAQVGRGSVREDRDLPRRADHAPRARTSRTTPSRSRPSMRTPPTITTSAAAGEGTSAVDFSPPLDATVTRRNCRFGAVLPALLGASRSQRPIVRPCRPSSEAVRTRGVPAARLSFASAMTCSRNPAGNLVAFGADPCRSASAVARSCRMRSSIPHLPFEVHSFEGRPPQIKTGKGEELRATPIRGAELRLLATSAQDGERRGVMSLPGTETLPQRSAGKRLGPERRSRRRRRSSRRQRSRRTQADCSTRSASSRIRRW